LRTRQQLIVCVIARRQLPLRGHQVPTITPQETLPDEDLSRRVQQIPPSTEDKSKEKPSGYAKTQRPGLTLLVLRKSDQ
jgi:hypothetical protein